jgi:uncharacterized membrane protein YhaH (DUF805 family)
MNDKRILLPLLWVFMMVNYIFCDVFSLFHSETLNQLLSGTVDGIELDEKFLFIFSIIMEIPMLMILVSRLAKHRINRILNVVFPIVLIVIQVGSLTAGSNTMHYIFFSCVEIATLLVIMRVACSWTSEELKLKSIEN